MCFEQSTHVLDFGVCSNVLGIVGEIFEDNLPKKFKENDSNLKFSIHFTIVTHRFVVDWRQDDGFLDGSDHNLP